MGKVLVYSTRDKMNALVFVSKQFKDDFPDTEEILDVLDRHGVVFGIDIEKIRQFVANKVCNEKVIVAKGKPVTHGIAGRLEFLVEMSDIGKPQMLPNGRVDHMELKKLVNVKKGEQLVKRIPPVQGEDGVSVLGINIRPPEPEDAVLYVGFGTKISEKDPNILIASNDGALIVDDDGSIEVKTSRTIASDIDYSTGNITFSGDLKINGTIRSGFTVKAEGSIDVLGSMEDATVEGDSDVEIRGGASGKRRGTISCRGNLKIKHLENFNAKVHKDLIVSNSILNSEVYCGGKLKAASVVGGQIRVTHGMDVGEIGTEFGVKTLILIGHDEQILQLQKELKEEMDTLNHSFHTKKEEAYQIVDVNMDNNGELPDEVQEKLKELRDEIKIIQFKISDLQKKIDKVYDKIKSTPKPEIRAAIINPNTVFRYGDSETMIPNKLKGRIITVEDGKILI